MAVEPNPPEPSSLPPKHGGAGWITTRVEALMDWGRRNSLWPMPFGTACCAIEMMATLSSRYDLSRFGAEVIRFSPRQSDLMIVSGRIALKMMPVLIEIYSQMPEPSGLPPKHGGAGWITTRVEALMDWGRRNSLWPMPFGTACCAIEMMATGGRERVAGHHRAYP